jgi:hypothetical protein
MPTLLADQVVEESFTLDHTSRPSTCPSTAETRPSSRPSTSALSRPVSAKTRYDHPLDGDDEAPASDEVNEEDDFQVHSLFGQTTSLL